MDELDKKLFFYIVIANFFLLGIVVAFAWLHRSSWGRKWITLPMSGAYLFSVSMVRSIFFAIFRPFLKWRWLAPIVLFAFVGYGLIASVYECQKKVNDDSVIRLEEYTIWTCLFGF